MECYRTRGKQFVAGVVLKTLDVARARLSPTEPGHEVLIGFLDVALDKWDESYNYLTYLGIDLLGLVPDADGATARRQRDEWVGLLLADLLVFETGARDEAHDWLPMMRPDADLHNKRLRLLEAALSTSFDDGDGSGLDERARRLLHEASTARTRTLLVSMQPVYVVHDEYLFIRVLQAFEVTFAAMAAELRDAIAAVRAGLAEEAAACLRRCAGVLAASRSLFSLLATMRAESFRAFRIYTVGASAIQSDNYKIFEALCSPPPRSRIDSPAYESVPVIRDRVLGEWLDLTSAVEESLARGVLDPEGRDLVGDAAGELEDVHQRWKQTHWKLAVRMIGEESGTGYTVGTPYLKSAIDNRLFVRLHPRADRG
ncbi:tryptophan 2,3-dioxygenase family protein [Streptosporangium sp. CA-135522]|uniref:tryptophan 2,3-dioxygenase family protein n=1 Tax=Streptosporangium sp. CA-135522 TaxID=3240072 RepID=UPI003D8FC4CD